MQNEEWQKKWDHRFTSVAREISTWSRDPSTKVGAVMVRDRRILATGYNGFPRGISDNSRLDVREQKYPLMVHAEINALMNALEAGISSKGADLYVYGLPCCPECSKNLLNTGLATIIMHDPATCPREDWREIWRTKSWPLFIEAGGVATPGLRFLERTYL